MKEQPRLTWHRHSILPYASLWHTLHRACELNGLALRELRTWVSAWDFTEKSGPTYGIVRDQLAAVLGESPEVFRWSTIDDAPVWLRAALFSPHGKVCPQCLAAGYHSDLFSLRGAAMLPNPQRTECCCGRPFLLSLTSPDGPPGSCPCNRLRKERVGPREDDVCL